MLPDSSQSFRMLKYVQIPMPDGVRLSGHVMLPPESREHGEQAGSLNRFPAILEYTPYHKTDYDKPWPRFRKLIDAGYAVVHVDIRGTGDSEGNTHTFADPQQIRDGVEVVEWIARQPWSDGKVGMWGISY